MDKKMVPTVCPYCAVGCSLYAVVEDGRITGLEYAVDAPLNEGALCAKGNAAFEVLGHPDRLLTPQKRENGGWKSISWDEALDVTAEKLIWIRDQYGPDALGFICSAKCTNEENYLLQKMSRLFGTNNVDHCARLCHSSTLTGLTATLGAGAMTNPVDDLANAGCIFIIGSNPAENHPVAARWLLDAKEKGAFIIVADPRYTPTARLSDLHLQLKPGTDIALINAMMHTILNEGLHHVEFIAQRTSNFTALERLIEGYAPQDAAALTGAPAGYIVQAARVYARSKASAIVYCMGVTQHRSGTLGAANCANLAMLCGHVGRPGTGINPLRGQDNVQGACDMGGLPDLFPGYQVVADSDVRAKFAALWETPPERLSGNPGLTLVEMEEAAGAGQLKAMIIMGENSVVSNPNSRQVRESLSKLDFLVVQDIFPTETSELAHLRLPAAAWAEKCGSKTTTDRRVQWSFQAVEPPGEARPDRWIVCQLGERLGLGENFRYDDAEDVLIEISRAVPIYGGMTPARLKSTPGGIHWPCPEPGHSGTPILYEDHFESPEGRGVFVPVEYEPPAEAVGPSYPFLLTTGRVALHFNSGSMSRRTESLQRRSPEVFIEINSDDAAREGITEGERVIVSTPRGAVEAVARVRSAIMPGVLFMPFHFPETNELTTDVLDPRAKIPEFKAAACRVQKASGSRA